jgi:amino acid transporter
MSPHTAELPERGEPWLARVKRFLIGGKRDLHPGVFHKVSLIALLAWVGLGADGLSSSAYGPEEAFKTLGAHTYLALALAAATAVTVLVISYAYSRIIEQFPLGGGGYVVASRLLGHKAGVVSGSALIVDYILTISISIAAAGDAIFSFFPPAWSGALVVGVVPLKLLLEFLAIGFLILLNLRGVKESVIALAPLFLTFLISHAVLIGGVILGHVGQIPTVWHEARQGFAAGLAAPPVGLGLAGMLALFARAYALGGGTYTGIEAVSNGLSIMREPKVQTGKRTMALMAVSLATTAGGLILAYLILHATPAPGRTMNAVLANEFARGWVVKGVGVGTAFVFITLLSEALLLVVAGQAGFIDGPRVMANMAVDSYLPHRFSQLSDRLTMSYGVLLMGGASLLALVYTRGNVASLVVMYSINVFLTFSLSELSMCRFWIRERKRHPTWRKHISIHATGLTLCVFILAVTTYEKFGEGGWITLAITGALIGLCFLIRAHYRNVHSNLTRLDRVIGALPSPRPATSAPQLDPAAPTAVLLVGEYAGLGVHSLLTVQRLFPEHFKNFIFVSVGVIDSASFVNVEAVDEVRSRTRGDLQRYVELATGLGLPADSRMAVGTEAVAVAAEVCNDIAREFPESLFFAGKLIFQRERWYQRLLHNETAYQLQRRLQFAGLNAMVLPVRVTEAA